MATPDPPSPLQESLNAIQARLNGTDQKLAALENTVSSLTMLKSAQEQPGRGEPEKQNPFWEFLKTLAGAVVIFAVPVYAAGWGFLYRYYRGFGLNISDLDIPLYETLIYSFRAFFDKPIWTVCALAALMTGLILNARLGNRLRAIPREMAVFVFLAAYVLGTYGLFLLGARSGHKHASEDMMADSSTLPFVAILVNAEAFQRDGQDYLKFDKTEFKLLLHANKQYFFFRPLKGQESTNSFPNRNIEVYVIADDKIRVIHLQRSI
jgi:hypothetical protein